MKKLLTILCVLVLVAGIAITASDGVINIFGCSRFWQYTSNFAFICLVMPACVSLLVGMKEGRI